MENFFLYLLIMAGVTYLVRMLPLTVFKKKIESRFIKSLLYYIPYAVLGAMTFPAILYSTAYIWSAVVGLGVAVLLSFKEKDLLIVAVCACIAVVAAEWAGRLL